MFFILSIVVCGAFTGYILRNCRYVGIVTDVRGLLVNVLVAVLLFVLGVDVGSNESIIESLVSIGYVSFVITIFSVLGSAVMALVLWKWLNKKTVVGLFSVEEKTVSLNFSLFKGSFISISFFCFGILLALYGCVPDFFVGTKFGYVVLSSLMFCVGVGTGLDKKMWTLLKSFNIKQLLLPLFTIVGTLIGAALAAFFIPLSLSESMAVASGLGYYSLSSILISERLGAELATMALLSNIIREIVAILFAPIFLYIFGKLAPISVAGATSADTALPIITKCSGNDYVVLSIYHGISGDVTVPLLVSLFCWIALL